MARLMWYIKYSYRYHIVQKQPPDMFYKKGVLRCFAKFTGKRLCLSLFFNKVAGLAGLRPATLSKKRLGHRCFPMNFAKFLRKPLPQNTFRQLPLIVENEFLHCSP